MKRQSHAACTPCLETGCPTPCLDCPHTSTDAFCARRLHRGVNVVLQVCIEELKKLSREEGVKALPFAQIYKPGQGKLVGLDIPPSKVSRACCTVLSFELFHRGEACVTGNVWLAGSIG